MGYDHGVLMDMQTITTYLKEHDHEMTATMKSNNHNQNQSMVMYFHSDMGKDFVFIEQCKPNTLKEMIWICLIIFVLAVSYESIKYYRDYLLKSWRITPYYVSDTLNGIRTNDRAKSGIPGRDSEREIRKRMLSYSHLFQMVLHMLQFLISYLLMLVFMTYNVYFCTAVLIGAGVGYFLFGWYKSSAVDITEHCH